VSKPHITTASRNITIGSGPSNEGVWHRAVMVAKALHDAGRWDGEATLTLHKPYQLHQRLFGIERVPASALIKGQDFEIQERKSTMKRQKNGPFGAPHTTPQSKPPAKAILCANCGQERPNTSDDCPRCGDGSGVIIKRLDPAPQNTSDAPKCLRPNTVTRSPANVDERWFARIRWDAPDTTLFPIITVTYYDDGDIWMRAGGAGDLIYGKGRTVREAYRDFCRQQRLAKHNIAGLLRERKQLRHTLVTLGRSCSMTAKALFDAQKQIDATHRWLDDHNIPGGTITARLQQVHFQLMALQNTVAARQEAATNA